MDPYKCKFEDLLVRIDDIDPKRYDKTRNYLNGAVTWLSPFITHGVINTEIVALRVLKQHSEKSCYRLLYELAWREYFHRTWQKTGENIFNDVYQPQNGVESVHLPFAIKDGSLGIAVLDEGIQSLKDTGLMHNHLRMWVAGVTCNLGHTDWKLPAKWMYYHLLDGDLASNTLSWQWIAGTFSHKQYVANQNNINKYSESDQRGTWLDVDYETLAVMQTPECLQSRCEELQLTQEPIGAAVPMRCDKRIGLRSMWNLSPNWSISNEVDETVLFIEQEQIELWPMAKHRWEFIQHWADQLGIQIWRGSVADLNSLCEQGVEFVHEEYPACAHWPGKVVGREFYFSQGDSPYRSFSQFWKQVNKTRKKTS